MKFIGSLALTLLAVVPALAAPQASGTASQAPTTTSVSLTPQQTCLNKCDAGDVTCQAACVGVAHPNESQVNDTTKCAEKCDQGDGSKEDTDKFASCVQGCISSYFPTSQTVGAAAGASSGASAATNSAATTGAAATGSHASGSAGPSQTGSSTASGTAASSSSTGAASSNMVKSSAVGLAGFFAALFAL